VLTEALVQLMAALCQSQELSLLCHSQPSSKGWGITKVWEKGSGKHCIVHKSHLLFKTLTHGEFPVNAEKTVKPCHVNP